MSHLLLLLLAGWCVLQVDLLAREAAAAQAHLAELLGESEQGLAKATQVRVWEGACRRAGAESRPAASGRRF